MGGVCALGWRCSRSSGPATQARHEIHKSPPGKVGFCISGDLLGRFPPPLDQFQQGLAAASQSLAFLEFVEQRHSLARELHENLGPACSAYTLAIGGAVLSRSGFIRHGRTRLTLTREKVSTG
jgi:hypothetical protein